MKQNETELRNQRPPFALVLTSGNRVRVHSYDHIDYPPMEDDNGIELTDDQRSDFFLVWGNGRSYRWVAFTEIAVIEGQTPKESRI